MTYLNSDDMLTPNAIRFAVAKFQAFPEVKWLTGRPCELDESGQLRKIHETQVFPQVTLAAGLHDGEHLPFVMQEGTFWTGCLWNRAGGIRTDLRLAGDYDLWRRFAEHEALYSTEVLLGLHRRHSGQLSSGSRYTEELEEKALNSALRDERDSIWAGYRNWHANGLATLPLHSQVLQYDSSQDTWVKQYRWLPRGLAPARYVAEGRSRKMGRVEFQDGFSAEEYADLHINLGRGARFARLGASRLVLHSDAHGVHFLMLRLRNFAESATLTIRRGEQTVLTREVPHTGHDFDAVVSAEVRLEPGENLFEVTVAESPEGPKLGLLVLCVETVPAELAF
ncbi:MAG: hypothetical protein FJW30_04375 [Acidobacteria bacterium]|nr:hypothetical protein [Acidobacteriota bacterium]